MVASKKIENLTRMIEPAVNALDCDLWGLEYQQNGRHAVLRIYIDAESGVNVDQCAAVSRQASAVLDVEDPIAGAYSLEVSSPGMDRPLFKLEQYGDYLGEKLTVRLMSAIDNRRNFKGLLTAIDEALLSFEVDGTEFQVPYSQIEKANVVPNFETLNKA